MDSEKPINLFELKKKNKLPDYLLKIYFVYRFVNNFPALLSCKINVLDFFDMDDFFQIFFTSQNTEILTK